MADFQKNGRLGLTGLSGHFEASARGWFSHSWGWDPVRSPQGCIQKPSLALTLLQEVLIAVLPFEALNTLAESYRQPPYLAILIYSRDALGEVIFRCNSLFPLLQLLPHRHKRSHIWLLIVCVHVYTLGEKEIYHNLSKN